MAKLDERYFRGLRADGREEKPAIETDLIFLWPSVLLTVCRLNLRAPKATLTCADAMWAQMDVNHRPHPYQGCATLRTVMIMHDQITTVGAAQDAFTWGQCGPDEAVPEQRVAGSFLEFLWVTLHDLRKPLFTNGDDHVVP